MQWTTLGRDGLGITRAHGINNSMPLSPRNPPGFSSRKESWVTGKGSVLLKEAVVFTPGRQRRNHEPEMMLACPWHLGTVQLFHNYSYIPDPRWRFQAVFRIPTGQPSSVSDFWICFKDCWSDTGCPWECPENSPMKKKYHLGLLFKLFISFYLIYCVCICVPHMWKSKDN